MLKAIPEGGEEPDWIKAEKENFKTFRDKNKDGVMDREEIANWILPNDFDHTLNEAKHLIFEADENKVRLRHIVVNIKLFFIYFFGIGW